jgi:hypothetical protein
MRYLFEIISVFFRSGQRLHQTPDKPLEKFGLFNGNRLVLIGDKVSKINNDKFCCENKMIL